MVIYIAYNSASRARTHARAFTTHKILRQSKLCSDPIGIKSCGNVRHFFSCTLLYDGSKWFCCWIDMTAKMK